MEFHKNLSVVGWEKVKKRQLHRLPLVDEWMALIEMKTGDSVLDIGPGPGVFTLCYAKAVGSAGKVTALEKSEEAAAYLTNELAHADTKIDIIWGDAEDALFHHRGPFDSIMLTDVLHHADSPSRVLQNLYNNLHTRHTRILISEFDPGSKGEVGPPLDKRLSNDALLEILKSIGFTVISSGKQLFEHYYMIAYKNMITENSPLAVSAVEAIHTGDVPTLKRMLTDNPHLATARIVGDKRDINGMSRTLLHVASDWPGHFPNGAATVGVLIEAGAEVNARFTGPHTETPLHWAASSNDIEVLDALLDAGADIEAQGAVIAGGTPLDDAVAFGQWQAARRLVECGARPRMWHAAALGLMDVIQDYFAGNSPPAPAEITEAFWQACHGGQRQAAEYLLERGADHDWIGYDGLTPLDTARRSNAHAVVEWLRSRGARSAGEVS